jgi:TonB family protein
MERRMSRFPKKAVAISLAVHIAVIAGAIWLPTLLSRHDVPGPGEEVQVWLTEPSGDVAFGAGHGTLEASAGRTRATNVDRLALPSERANDPEESEGSAQRAGGSRGIGGPGTSRGEGGSELLSRIWRRINESKYYPASARRSGITGSPRVAFALDESGQVRWVKLVRSSGKRILDDAAIETVRRAAPLPYYPKPITVAVRYSLSQ